MTYSRMDKRFGDSAREENIVTVCPICDAVCSALKESIYPHLRKHKNCNKFEVYSSMIANKKRIQMPLIEAKGKSLLEINAQLIGAPKMLPVTFKRLVTKDGLDLTDNAPFKIGMTVTINIESLRGMEFVLKNGNRIVAPVVNIYDATGKDLGWIYAELFFT